MDLSLDLDIFLVTAAAPSKRSSADGFSPRFLAVRVSFGSLPQQLCFHFPQCLAVWIKHWRTVADNSRQHFILVHIWLNHNLDPAIYVMEFLPLRYRSNCKSYEESAALAAVCTLFPVIQLKLDCIKCLKLLSKSLNMFCDNVIFTERIMPLLFCWSCPALMLYCITTDVRSVCSWTVLINW